MLAPAHRTVCSSDGRDFVKKDEMSYAAAASHYEEQRRFRWELEEMQRQRGSCVDTRVDFEAGEAYDSEPEHPFLPRSCLRRLPPHHHHRRRRKSHLDLCAHVADPNIDTGLESPLYRPTRIRITFCCGRI